MEQDNHIQEDISMEALQSGHERLFEALFVQYYQALAFFAEQIVKDESTAKEIVQEVFVKLWERKKTGPNILNIKSYLYTATRNHCLNYLENYNRKQRKAEEYGNMAPQSEDGILREIIRSEVIREIAFAVEQLPLQCKKVIKMTFDEGKTADEIAAELDVSVSTVRNQKARGLSLLKKLLSHATFIFLLTFLG